MNGSGQNTYLSVSDICNRCFLEAEASNSAVVQNILYTRKLFVKQNATAGELSLK